ncbi:MAG: hypothetical protein ACO3YZ_04650 [Candidatus Nanopelagicaceae bacterium]
MDANAVGTQLPNRFGQILLGQLISANMNSTADQQITIFSAPAKYIIRRIVVTNASVSLTTAVGGVYPAVSKGGTAIVANSQAYSGLSASGKFIDLTIASGYTSGGDVLTATNVYLSLTTPQGAAATADIYVFGDIVTL